MDKLKTQDAEREGAAMHGAAPSPSTSEPTKEVQAPKVEQRGAEKAEKTAAPAHRHGAKKVRNNVRRMRTERMMSKAELARRAVMSTLTIDRVERGLPCRMDTKRKILEALGLKPTDRVAVFGDEED